MNTSNSKLEQFTENLGSSQLLICKKCGKKMVGYPGDDECYECAFPEIKKFHESEAYKALCGKVHELLG
jgi:rubrerythrin